MKFKNYLENITGIGIYPMISLILFTVIFILVIVMVLRTNDDEIKRMGNLPLDNDE